MKTAHILKFTISFCIGFISIMGYSQEKSTDTTIYKSPYGIRVGMDISRPIINAFNKEFSGFEIVGDYRFTKNLYAAIELGFENKTTIEDYTNSTSKGSFAKIGVNYNVYDNWLDMNNEIYFGFRYGFSVFQQTLNSYTPNTGSAYFDTAYILVPKTETGLKSHWTEFILGIKVETFKNLFLGASFSYKIMVSVQDQKDFKTLYVPGFNTVFESNTGFGFNYTISYTIPFVKK